MKIKTLTRAAVNSYDLETHDGQKFIINSKDGSEITRSEKAVIENAMRYSDSVTELIELLRENSLVAHQVK